MQCGRAICQALKRRSFYTKSVSFNEEDPCKFAGKPKWFKKFKLKQAKFQKDDGLPVFLKGGLPDKILYNITLGLFVVGMLGVFKHFHYFDQYIGK